MPYSFMMLLPGRGRPALRLASLVLATASALTSGCTIIVGESGGGHHDSSSWERCYEEYDDCLDDADGDKHAVEVCGAQLDVCDGGQDGDGGVTDGGGDGQGGDGQDGDGQDDAPAVEICVSLHKTCIAGADSIEDTLACEALFDHCAHPEPCPNGCAEVCPEDGLAACLTSYGACVAAASIDVQVDACNAGFDGCVDGLGAPACLPDDDPLVDACLTEHALCTACAGGDDELATCNDIFDACIQPPM